MSGAGDELWVSDGTAGGTQLLRDIAPGSISSNPANLMRVGDLLYFTADDGTTGQELWRTDGTPAGTVLVKDVDPRLGVGSSIEPLAAFGDRLVFSATTAATGRELWLSDGTTAGTALAVEIAPGVNSAEVHSAATIGGRIVFNGNDFRSGDELFQYTPATVDPPAPVIPDGGTPLLPTATAATPTLTAPARISRTRLKKGIQVRLGAAKPSARVTIRLKRSGKTRVTKQVLISTKGTASLTLKLSSSVRSALRKGQKLTVEVTVPRTDGVQVTLRRTITIS